VKVSATELANESKAILDRVIQQGTHVEIQRHGRTVAEIRPRIGVSRQEALRRLREIQWTDAESEQLKSATKEANKVFGYAGSH
jgi:antitoxin (DNA-binding transcriptional repressor) of toxin-antitoxin stability system